MLRETPSQYVMNKKAYGRMSKQFAATVNQFNASDSYLSKMLTLWKVTLPATLIVSNV